MHGNYPFKYRNELLLLFLGMKKKKIKKKEKYNERNYRQFEEYRLNSLQNMFYSIQRTDLIIISVSTGGIVILLSFVNSLNEREIVLDSCDKFLTFFSILFFIITIFINIGSQFTAKKYHDLEANWALQEMNELNNIDKEDVQDSKIWDDLTILGNKTSLTTLIIGVILSVILLGGIIF